MEMRSSETPIKFLGLQAARQRGFHPALNLCFPLNTVLTSQKKPEIVKSCHSSLISTIKERLITESLFDIFWENKMVLKLSEGSQQDTT